MNGVLDRSKEIAYVAIIPIMLIAGITKANYIENRNIVRFSPIENGRIVEYSDDRGFIMLRNWISGGDRICDYNKDGKADYGYRIFCGRQGCPMRDYSQEEMNKIFRPALDRLYE